VKSPPPHVTNHPPNPVMLCYMLRLSHQSVSQPLLLPPCIAGCPMAATDTFHGQLFPEAQIHRPGLSPQTMSQPLCCCSHLNPFTPQVIRWQPRILSMAKSSLKLKPTTQALVTKSVLRCRCVTHPAGNPLAAAYPVNGQFLPEAQIHRPRLSHQTMSQPLSRSVTCCCVTCFHVYRSSVGSQGYFPWSTPPCSSSP
jgi:hypothetical protein